MQRKIYKKLQSCKKSKFARGVLVGLAPTEIYENKLFLFKEKVPAR